MFFELRQHCGHDCSHESPGDDHLRRVAPVSRIGRTGTGQRHLSRSLAGALHHLLAMSVCGSPASRQQRPVTVSIVTDGDGNAPEAAAVSETVRRYRRQPECRSAKAEIIVVNRANLTSSICKGDIGLRVLCSMRWHGRGRGDAQDRHDGRDQQCRGHHDFGKRSTPPRRQTTTEFYCSAHDHARCRMTVTTKLLPRRQADGHAAREQAAGDRN